MAPLYGSVDPEVHRPAPPVSDFAGDLSYLGTYAADRQHMLQSLFVEPAKRSPHWRFVIGGAQYPADFPWTPNMYFVRHMPPPQHPAFYCSSRLTLNVTRKAMAAMGYCPAGRLFEAAACGVPIVSDEWEGLDHFYASGSEILLCSGADAIVDAMSLGDHELKRISAAARERTLGEHTAYHRALQLESYLEEAACGA